MCFFDYENLGQVSNHRRDHISLSFSIISMIVVQKSKTYNFKTFIFDILHIFKDLESKQVIEVDDIAMSSVFLISYIFKFCRVPYMIQCRVGVPF